MSKIIEAKDILQSLGLPKAQQNEMAALTLLALCNLKETDPWHKASKNSLGISKGIMTFVREEYGKQYAPNTRETFRRQVLHQFVQARIADYNPDIPNLPVNSPRAHYAISPIALKTIKQYNTPDWETGKNFFLKNVANLSKKYAAKRNTLMVPVKLPSGKTFKLSPGTHNELQAAIIEEFAPRFAKNSTVLYLGDTEQKNLFLDKKGLKELGIVIDEHSKLPDIVLLEKQKGWIYLIEAVTSHGPISPKRKIELQLLFEQSKLGIVFVTAFLDFSSFKKFSKEIAWDTEAWILETPEHMIHFNGDRFLGPR